MILGEPSLRPTTSAVLKHPLFWSKEKSLTYLQDVSDRVDRETTDSYILASIERNRMEIVKGDFSHIILQIISFFAVPCILKKTFLTCFLKFY